MPGPEVYLSNLAARTERVHVGSAIFNVTPPVNKPVRVAETVALLDHITEGRFEFGSGRGSSTTEVFGFDIDDLDETSKMWDEAIREIPKMWKDGEYSYEGTYFRVPPRQVFPKPYGHAHPPMWVAAGSPPTFAKAGQDGARRVLLHARHAEQDRSADRRLQGGRRRRPSRWATSSTTTSWS